MHNEQSRISGEHPLPDDTKLDHYFTYPRASKGQTLLEFLIENDEKYSTYMFWDDYIRAMWGLKTPIDPNEKFLAEKIKFVTPRRRVGNMNLSSIPTESRKNPFDYFTELAPLEVLVSVRLLRDTTEDVDKLSAYLKEKIKKHNVASRHPKFVNHFLYVALRLWDFEQRKGATRGNQVLSRSTFREQLYEETIWINYVRRLKRNGIVKKVTQGSGKQWPSDKLMSELYDLAEALINRRNYQFLIRRSKETNKKAT